MSIGYSLRITSLIALILQIIVNHTGAIASATLHAVVEWITVPACAVQVSVAVALSAFSLGAHALFLSGSLMR